MKRIFVILLCTMFFFGCSNSNSTSPQKDIVVYYVENQKITQTWFMSELFPDKVAQKWLEENGLEAQLQSVGVWIENDFLEDRLEGEAPQPSEFSYSYRGYQIFFSNDIEAVFQGENGDLYRESFHMTLDKLYDQISEEASERLTS